MVHLTDSSTDRLLNRAAVNELFTLQPVFNGQDRQELLRQIAWEDPKAMRKLEDALAAAPEDVRLRAVRGSVFTRRGEPEEARQWLEQAVPLMEQRPAHAPQDRLEARLLRHELKRLLKTYF
jgi:hypothetical protein